MARKLTCEASPGELEELKVILQNDSVLKEKLKIVTECWKREDEKAALKINEVFKNIRKKIKG